MTVLRIYIIIGVIVKIIVYFQNHFLYVRKETSTIIIQTTQYVPHAFVKNLKIDVAKGE